MQTNEIIQVNTIDQYNKLFGIETRHPLIGIVDLNRPEQLIPYKMNIGFYALFLKEEVCGELTYGRGRYDYQEGTVVALAPGQIVGLNNPSGVKPPASKGLLFHPDLIRGTALGQEIRNYQFFSYEANEALHLSLEEGRIVADCLNKIATELEHPIDKHSRRLITAHIGVLLDYCLRFYDRQFTTRSEQNRDVIVRFERLLDEYFENSMPQSEGLPSVRYFAEKVFLSPNYFGDMVRKQTGKTASEYIQTKIIERAKENLLSSDKTTSQIALELGFQYPQHLSRMFKRIVGCTPNEFRTGTESEHPTKQSAGERGYAISHEPGPDSCAGPPCGRNRHDKQIDRFEDSYRQGTGLRRDRSLYPPPGMVYRRSEGFYAGKRNGIRPETLRFRRRNADIRHPGDIAGNHPYENGRSHQTVPRIPSRPSVPGIQATGHEGLLVFRL